MSGEESKTVFSSEKDFYASALANATFAARVDIIK
jgi:hypothetical protein